jgi:L-ascorbate metabolism protein UlaG (beta-lactamase superfamily)
MVGEEYQIDLALLNIGGHFGMEPRMAARAAKSVRARLAVPQHFATFPGIAANPRAFAAELKRLGVPFYEMRPGETLTFRGARITHQNKDAPARPSNKRPRRLAR